MRILTGSFLLIAACFTIGACASASDGADPTGQTESAVTGSGGMCETDSNCRSPLVCDLHCPVIPGREHCEIAGGTCSARCELSTHQLEGMSFVSTDGSESIAFAAGAKFTKLVGCPNTGIHCDHIQEITGTFTSDGTSIRLHPTTGASDTVKVEKHCYDGIFDDATGLELYPSN
jgi:hypothetical protein